MHLNGRYVLERRRQLGMGLRELARLVGVGVAQVKPIEQGVSLDALSLREVSLLAKALSCREADVLDPGTAASGTTDKADGVLAFLGSCLMSADRAIPVDALCELVGLGPKEMEGELDRLDAFLDPVGVRVRRLQQDGAVKLVPGPECSGDDVKRAIRAALARNGLNARGAKIVFDVINGRVVERDLSCTPSGRVEYGRLLRAGVLSEPTGSAEPLQLSPETRFSLLIDD